MKRSVIPQLLLIAALLLAIFWRDPSFDRRQLHSVPANLAVVLRRIAVVLLLGGAAVLAMTIASSQVRVFAFTFKRPFLWLAIVLLYALTSAPAQELIFRVFIFHRYQALFTGAWAMILASTCSFALAHLQLGNVVAPTLSVFGGMRFAYTYANTRSLPVVSLEHGLWGDWIFTIGLGAYFYGGHFSRAAPRTPDGPPRISRLNPGRRACTASISTSVSPTTSICRPSAGRAGAPDAVSDNCARARIPSVHRHLVIPL